MIPIARPTPATLHARPVVAASLIDVIELFHPDAVRRADERVIAAGTPGRTLMERAGGHLARLVTEVGGHTAGLHVVVLAGKGANGGDGYVAARRLTAEGVRVVVHAVGGSPAPGSDAAAAREGWLAAGGRSVDGPPSEEDVAQAEVVVDALLGTGTRGAPRGQVAAAIAAVAAHRHVVACDVPSGVDAATGTVSDVAITATATLCLGHHKTGLWLWPARGRCGRLVLGDLGFATHDPAPEAPQAHVLGSADVARLAPAPDPEAEKRSRGVVALMAGSPGMAGAAILAARGAQAAGAGMVACCVPVALADVVTAAVPEALVWTLPDDPDDHAEAVLGRLDGVDALAIGPGLGLSSATQSTVHRLVREAEVPLVLDADGLNAFRDRADDLTDHAAPLLAMTPHRRELARLTGGDAWAQRIDVVRDRARRWGATVLAKGPGTIITAPDATTWVTGPATPALATGGTGDVLTGVITALLAARPDPVQVAVAAWVHARAGQLAAESAGDPRAVTAGGVATAVGRAWCSSDPA